MGRAVWFIDSPFLFTNLAELKHTKVFSASRELNAHPEAHIQKWLPFAGYDPRRPSKEPEANIGFLGLLLPMVYYITRMQNGLVGSKSGHIKPDAKFFEKAQQPSFTTFETWKTPDQWALPAAEIFNFASSHHRVRTLSWFEDLGLEIMGPSNWQADLWAVNPYLLKNFTEGSISGENAMREYLSRYRICLNIFHLQNVSGGPNFRSMDAASNYIPCLSQFNEGCAEIFPEDVAAVYFRNCDDARYKAKQLLADPSLRQKIANNAAEIVNESHTFAKRARELCEHLNLKVPAAPTKAPIIYLHWPAGEWTRSATTESQIDDGSAVVIAQAKLPRSAKPKNRRPMWSRLARSVRKRLSLEQAARN
ncbi:MAG: glycosyltransferase family 1 protein [Proteobacteria bacterium]|nr:glycosyltransferase family 1 protein [Pseudomonadota bacterium]